MWDMCSLTQEFIHTIVLVTKAKGVIEIRCSSRKSKD